MSPSIRPLIYLLALIDLVLKGVTLYKSARREQTVWFILLLIVNSFGILPIVYLIANKDIALSGTSKPAIKRTTAKKKRK